MHASYVSDSLSAFEDVVDWQGYGSSNQYSLGSAYSGPADKVYQYSNRMTDGM